MLTYTDISSRVAAGQTAEQIAEELSNSGMTVKPILNSDIEFYLRELGLLYQGVDRPYEGAMADLIRNTQVPEEVRTTLMEFVTHVYGSFKTLSTDTVEIASRGKILLAGLVSLGLMDADMVTGFYSLGGGLKYAGITASDVQAVIDAHERDIRYTNARLAADSAYAAGKSDAEIVAAFGGAMDG